MPPERREAKKCAHMPGRLCAHAHKAAVWLRAVPGRQPCTAQSSGMFLAVQLVTVFARQHCITQRFKPRGHVPYAWQVALHCTALHCTAHRCTALHCTAHCCSVLWAERPACGLPWGVGFHERCAPLPQEPHKSALRLPVASAPDPLGGSWLPVQTLLFSLPACRLASLPHCCAYCAP